MKGAGRMDIGVAALLDLPLRRRRSCYAYVPSDEGSARLRPGHARFLSWPLAFVRPHGRVGGSLGFWGRSFLPFCPGGFNRRFEAGRFGFNRFGPNRFDHFGFNRFNRFGFNRFGGNQLFVGGWGGWGGFPAPAASEPIIVGDSAPVIINIGVDPAAGDAGAAYNGGCVIHKLNYDSNGKYAGERQIPRC
jgi:hypothetical protein